ncbi:gluconate kinase 1 [Salmonella enterica subsp. arizonae]|nr:gluconate kinase 1 [Salmonella enterica subsp. arizonae]
MLPITVTRNNLQLVEWGPALSTTNHDHHVYVLMGVSGSGKSAVASAVAHQLHAAFLDGDFLHPRCNIEKNGFRRAFE